MSVFNIVTEFRFDIAHAVADSKTLQNQVGLISDTANQALYSLKRVGVGLVAQMGLFSGGTLGFLYSAIQASEKFGQTQRKLANVFLANKDAMGQQGMTFLSAMKQSEKIMESIKTKAFEFALDPEQLIGQTSSIAPMLLSHGLDDNKLTKSIDISRGLLKSAPTLGVDPGMIQGQLINLVMGRAGLENTLFQRLMSETKPFKDNNINDSKSFNIMPAQKRIEVLRQSLLQFGSNAEVIAGNVNSLSGQMTKFTSMIKGTFSVLKPLGDALMVPIIKAFKYVNQWIDTNGRQIIESVTNLVKGFLEDPVKAYVQLRQLGRLKGDLQLASRLTYLYGLFHGGVHILELFGIKLGGVSGALRLVFGYLRTGIGWLLSVVPWVKILSFSFSVLKTAFLMTARILAPIIFFLQIFSATLAKLEVIWGSWMAENAGRTAQTLERIGAAFSKIMLPLTMAIDGMSDLLSGLLGWFATKEILLDFFEKFAVVLEFLGKVVVHVLSLISGMTNALIGQIYNLSQGNYKDIFSKKSWSNLADEGYKDFWNKYYPTQKTDEELPTSGHVTNIGTVNLSQQFKEQMEPDRIAFAFVDQMKKLAMNPTQSSGRSMSGGMVGK